MQEGSLRERKKARTWHDIHVAAAEAVLERGLQAVTVEDIAASVGISQRTFFNYFPNKEGAILGDDPTLPDDAALADFVGGGPAGDLLADLGAQATG